MQMIPRIKAEAAGKRRGNGGFSNHPPALDQNGYRRVHLETNTC